MKAVSGKEFVKLLEQNGWELLRVKGSHHVYGKAGISVRLSIPIHRNQPLKTGLLKHFMKVAGIPEQAL